MAGPTVSLLELRDEFAFVRNDALFADVASSLNPNSVKVVLVRGKKNNGIAGVISETHFLRVCTSGVDPARTFARDKMQTDLLRLRDDTPLDDAVGIIEERDPDAVLVLNAENEFLGYLSPQDFRQLELAHVGEKDSGPSSPPPVKSDVSHSLDLGDEFAFVRNDAAFSDASRMLAPEHVKVILVRAKKDKGIAGVLTEPEFLKVCATGINPNKTLVNKHMLTDILRIRSDTPLEEAIKIIGEKDPDAVLVLSDENKFVGYLSPADYNEAIELLKKKKAEVFDVPAIKPEIPPPPPTLRDVLRPVPKTIEGGPGRELPLPNCDAMMAIATRGSESHGVHLLQIDGARIESQSEMIHEGDRTISLWPLRSVEGDKVPLRSYLEIVEGAHDDGALIMLMDGKSARQRLSQHTWDHLVMTAQVFAGAE